MQLMKYSDYLVSVESLIECRPTRISKIFCFYYSAVVEVRLVTFRHRKVLVRFRKTLWFGLK